MFSVTYDLSAFKSEVTSESRVLIKIVNETDELSG